MVSKGASNPLSLIKSLKFFENLYANKTKKSLGQNFLIDENILKKICDAGNVDKQIRSWR